MAAATLPPPTPPPLPPRPSSCPRGHTLFSWGQDAGSSRPPRGHPPTAGVATRQACHAHQTPTWEFLSALGLGLGLAGAEGSSYGATGWATRATETRARGTGSSWARPASEAAAKSRSSPRPHRPCQLAPTAERGTERGSTWRRGPSSRRNRSLGRQASGRFRRMRTTKARRARWIRCPWRVCMRRSTSWWRRGCNQPTSCWEGSRKAARSP